jgi:hypothetical protein
MMPAFAYTRTNKTHAQLCNQILCLHYLLHHEYFVRFMSETYRNISQFKILVNKFCSGRHSQVGIHSHSPEKASGLRLHALKTELMR